MSSELTGTACMPTIAVPGQGVEGRGVLEACHGSGSERDCLSTKGGAQRRKTPKLDSGPLTYVRIPMHTQTHVCTHTKKMEDLR